MKDKPTPTPESPSADLIDALHELKTSVDSSNRANTFWPTLMRGVVGSLGAVLGATIVIAIVIFILQKLSGVPFVGQLFQLLLHTLQRK